MKVTILTNAVSGSAKVADISYMCQYWLRFLCISSICMAWGLGPRLGARHVLPSMFHDVETAVIFQARSSSKIYICTHFFILKFNSKETNSSTLLVYGWHNSFILYAVYVNFALRYSTLSRKQYIAWLLKRRIISKFIHTVTRLKGSDFKPAMCECIPGLS